MKKTRTGYIFNVIKFDLKMKLTGIFFILFLFQIYANNTYSQKTKITLDVKNMSIESILFDKIEKDTDFKFFYENSAINLKEKVSIRFTKERIDKILDFLFTNTDINYEILDKQIILTKKMLKPVKVTASLLPNIEVGMIQQYVVQGVVHDNDGNPLPGASIVEKGTRNGTQSDFDGNFSLSVADENATLVFSYIGFATQEVSVAGQTNVSVSLQESAAGLDEVVVIGYGSKKKINLTGAVSTVTAESIENRPITSAATALQGTTSGVFVNQNSGQPGRDDILIRIRGVGTLNNANPLILVDGIEASMNNINPSDIESISVLKDAASSAIYGSRAANGVVLVTTKRGAAGDETKFSYDSYYGITESVRLPEMVTDAVQFAEMRNEANTNFGNNPFFTDQQVADFRSRASEINTDWIDLLFGAGSMQQHNFSVAGGSENTNFRVSFGYLDQEGTVPNSGFQRFNTRLNLDTKVGEKVKIGTSLSYSRGSRFSQLDNLGDFGSVVTRAIQAHPTFPAYDSQGRLAIGDPNFNGSSFDNPLAEVDASKFESVGTNLLGSVYLEYKPIEELTLKGTLAGNFSMNSNSTFNSSLSVFNWITEEERVLNATRSASKSNSQNLITTVFFTANYEKSFGESDLSVLGGYSQEESNSENFSAFRNGHLSNSVQVLNAGLSSTSTNSGGGSTWGLRSYFGRLNYTFKDRYLFEANVRVDGTSRFLNDKWGTFPSFSAGWIISNEAFLKDSETIDFLKLRGSWGQLGNQNIGDFAFSKSLSLSQSYNFGGNVVPGVAQTSLGNADLTWETTTTSNIGVNLGLFRSLSVEFDYFIRDTEDILIGLSIPALSGFTSQISNAAEVKNKGWDFTLNYNENFGDVGVSFGGNVTHVDNEITELDPRIPDGEVDRNISGRRITQQGSPINAYYGLVNDGIFQSQAEIDAAPDHSGLNPNFGPGDLRFKDIDGNGVVDSDDRVIIGKENPTWTYGFNIGFDYKGFDIAAIFQGAADFNSYAGEELANPFFNNAGIDTRWVDRWTPENTDATFPRLYLSDGPSTSRANSFFVLDRSYFRFKNLQIGYSLPKQVLDKTFLDKVRFYANGSNLFTITDFPYFDPERSATADRGGTSFPNLRIISAGVSLSF